MAGDIVFVQKVPLALAEFQTQSVDNPKAVHPICLYAYIYMNNG